MAHIYSIQGLDGGFRQQEILSDVNVPGIEIAQNGIDIDAIAFSLPYAIVVTQDCDLEGDYNSRFGTKKNADKEIAQIQICEVSPQSVKLPPGNKYQQELLFLKRNRHDRLFFLQKIPNNLDLLKKGTDEDLIVDFKKVYGVPTNYLYHQLNQSILARRCMLDNPYKEHFASKFFQWQGRIGLPQQYESTN